VISNRNNLKAALMKYGPLAVALYVDASFTALGDGIYGTFANDLNHLPKVINHAVLLIGWDDEKSAWIIKNSWGNDWGSAAGIGTTRGFGYVGYEQNNLGYAAAWVRAK
jgi:cathepsin L